MEDDKQNMNKKMTGGFKEEEEDDEERSKITEENIGSTKSITKKKKVIKEQQNSSNGSSKSDYIHVRARRGQATDSHSLAERVRYYNRFQKNNVYDFMILETFVTI